MWNAVSSVLPGGLLGFGQQQQPVGLSSAAGGLIEAAKRADMSLSAELTTPPDWDDHYSQALRNPGPFLKLKVDPASREYEVLQDFIGPGACQINEIHRVVNPALWRRFLATRKELICAKSNDFGVLGALGMEDEEIANRAASQLNPHLSEYKDNVALLFHCTRGQDVDAILSQGLDDRLANGGSYGRGIYFADDPVKSLGYDGTGGTLFIFAVHLGDICPAPGGAITREPAKANAQKRSQMDLFFDSVLGGVGYNEYVIFSRHQCCPLYMVSCQRGGGGGRVSHRRGTLGLGQSQYDSGVRRKHPPFVWAGNPCVPNKKQHPWPFFAKVIFQEMYPPRPQLETPPRGGVVLEGRGGRHHTVSRPHGQLPPVATTATASNTPQPKPTPSERTIEEHLSGLWEMGFTNNDENKVILARFDYDFPSAVNYLVENGYDINAQGAAGGSGFPGGDTSAMDTSIEEENERLLQLAMEYSLLDFEDTNEAPIPAPRRTVGGSGKTQQGDTSCQARVQVQIPSSKTWNFTKLQDHTATIDPIVAAPKEEECSICCMSYSTTSSNWKIMKCGHKICTVCSRVLQKSERTMSGQRHVFLKCPFCQVCDGVEIGTCPNGTMTVTKRSQSAEGFEGYPSICIRYQISQGPYLIHRTAFLPDTPEGNEVLRLLRIAWDRRLCFAIGFSATTGAQDVVVWNIHHKTALNGGLEAHGYPDPTYLTRVKAELKEFGVQ